MADQSDLSLLLERLAASGVSFVLVGGLAAVAQGAPITTFDIDIVPRTTADNIDRLLQLLETLNARYRGRPGPPLPPDRGALLGPGHSLLMTDLGPLDVLGAIEEGRSFDDLAPDSLTLEIGGHPVLVLSLDAIVRMKRGSAHTKDKLRLPILEATLRRRH